MKNQNIARRILQLIVFAVAPLVGVLFFNWDWREVILLYWLENVTIGIVTLIKIMRAGPVTWDKRGVVIPAPPTDNPKPLGGNILLAAFFSIHYGLFTFVHGIFVFVLIFSFGGPNEGGVNFLGILPLWLLAAVVYILGAALGAKPEETADRSFSNPYKRIVPLHIAIIFGVGAIALLNLPAIAALLLVGLHVVIDLLSMRGGGGNGQLRITNTNMVE